MCIYESPMQVIKWVISGKACFKSFDDEMNFAELLKGNCFIKGS